MNILAELRRRFAGVLAGTGAEVPALLAMVQPAKDAKHGDYQANFAMPLKNVLNKPPPEIAREIVAQTELADLCHPPEIAGPGFINLRLKDDWLTERVTAAARDSRLGIPPAAEPRTFVIDYSSPNVAKTMHVGHIRSTVIGDAIYRTLQFLGHTVIGDNHLGDWGTQFGMIIYGWKHFRDEAAYAKQPIVELNRLYRYVRKMMDYYEGQAALPKLKAKVEEASQELKRQQSFVPPKTGNEKAHKETAKKHDKAISKLKQQLEDAMRAELEVHQRLVGWSSEEYADLQKHSRIGEAVLAETAKLHEGDPENLAIWKEVLPHARQDIQRIYDRLGIRFDVEHGESFYHPMLGAVVEELTAAGLVQESEGAQCIFLEGFETPMIIRKRDGAFLYSTSDLATIKFREETWHPDEILYVVDFRQSEHFEKLFAAARRWGYDRVELTHVSFGTVLGDDGRPFKTRSGDTVNLEGLLDEAVRRALAVVSGRDDANPNGPQLSPERRQEVAEKVGIAALKYADLAHNRTSDYVFSYDKMLALDGNTATYMQYAYARVQSIFTKGEVDIATLHGSGAAIRLTNASERALAIELLKFGAALDELVEDYRPNVLTAYLFDLAKRYSAFYESSPVLKEEDPELRTSRLLLCDLTARTIKQGLALLGIEVVERM